VHDEIVDVLGGENAPIKKRDWLTIVMVVGLQGAGKTTTTAKLARHLSASANEVLLASMDVYRPAAQDQLKTLSQDIGVHFLESNESDPAALASAALKEAELLGSRWLFVDTAGRMHVDEAMMSEIKVLQEILNPAEIFYVVDAMAGQDAVNSVKAFDRILPLTGVVITKTDGDARGGVTLSIRESTGLPIKFIGTGEKLDALETFVPNRMASRILGMGDVVGLVEDVERQVDENAVKNVAGKLKRGRTLNLEDFKSQLTQVHSLGGIESLLDKIPGLPSIDKNIGGIDKDSLRRQIGIINSMTPMERRKPDLINGSRKRRIASGAGLPIQEVSRLLKQYRQFSKMMKRVSKGGIKSLLGGLQAGSAGRRAGRPRN
jgi:signal recognition particle subunit SRP54